MLYAHFALTQPHRCPYPIPMHASMRPMDVASHLYDFYFCKRVYSRVRFLGLLVCRRRRRRPLFYRNYALLSLRRKEPKVRHSVVRWACPCNGTICPTRFASSPIFAASLSSPEILSFFFSVGCRREKRISRSLRSATHQMDVDWKWCDSCPVHCALGTLDDADEKQE